MSYRKILLMKQQLWQCNTSCSKFYLTGSCMTEKITAWNKNMSVMQFHYHSFIRLYRCFQMFPFIICSSGRESTGMPVSKWIARRGIPLDWAHCSNIDKYSSLSCCSSTKYIRERSWYTVCTWKKPLLTRAVSTSACINEHDGETTELITSFCS